MPMVRAMRLLNAIEAGTLSGAQLDALFASDPSRLGEFRVLLGMPGQLKRMFASITTMDILCSSATAMATICGDRTAITTLYNASGSIPIITGSGIARLAIWNSDTALAAIQASNAAVTTMMAASAAVSANTSSMSHTFVPQGTKVILLRRWYGATDEYDHLRWSRTNGDLPGYGAIAIKYGPTYNSLGTGPTADNAEANNVRACNGLRREMWYASRMLSVRYLPV